jgi:cell division protein FtsB
MFEKNKTVWDMKRIKQLTDVRNLGLYIFAVLVLAITWSGIKTVQNNYDLQKQITVLKQQNDVLKLQNGTTALQNKYLETNQYLDLAARQNFGLAAPGEKVFLVPQSVAMKYVDPSIVASSNSNQAGIQNDDRPTYVKNLEDWRDFLLGRSLTD